MIAKISAAWKALKAGEELANVKDWKQKQIAINTLSAFIVALIGVAKAFDIEIPLVETDINNMAYTFVTLIGLVNVYLTTATTKKIGLKNESIRTTEDDSSII